MNARRRIHRSWLVGAIAATALTLGAGSAIATAEAAPQARGHSRSEQKARGQKNARGHQKQAKQKSGERYQRNDRSRDSRSQARHESRRGDDRGRYQDRRGDGGRYQDHRGSSRTYRGDRDRYVTGRRGHARIVVNHRRPHYLPRVIYRPRPVHVRPWFYGAQRIYVDDSPFYFNAGLGIYVGGLALNIQIGDVPPVGYVFYDPFCGETFWSVADYQAHLRFRPHPAVLSLIRVEYTDY